MKHKNGTFYRFGLISVMIALLIISQFTMTISACHDWDKSSIIVSGDCDEGNAIFIITNTGEAGNGDMNNESLYEIFRNNEFEENGTFQLNGGESITVSIDAQGDIIKMIAYQHPDHPGVGFSIAIVEGCGFSDSDDPDDNSSDVPDDNSSDVPDDNSSDVPDDNSSDVPDDNSSDVPDDNSSDVPDDNSSDVPDDNSSTNPDDRSDDPTDSDQDQPNDDSNNNNNPSSNPPQKQYFYTGNEELPNKEPIALANIENNTQFYNDDAILFDGSKSYDNDGNITEWIWDFGNDEIINGKIVTKSFDKQGIYSITLTVIDDDMADNFTTFNVIIEEKNIKPTAPEMIGKNNSFVGSNILFEIVSSDSNNDELQYIIDWDDGKTTKTDFYPQSTEITIDHTWKKQGTYTITVKAFDNQLYSEETSMTITIDEIFTANYGYIILLITAIFTSISLTTKTFFQDRALKALMS